MSKPTQTERVIAAARSPDGVCQADFLLPDVIDGGPPIVRVGARIQDAEERGHTFAILGWRRKTRVYRLVAEPEPAPSDRRTASVGDAASNVCSSPDPEQSPLFEAPAAGTEHWRGETA
jgi:hypothetical protein